MLQNQALLRWRISSIHEKEIVHNTNILQRTPEYTKNFHKQKRNTIKMRVGKRFEFHGEGYANDHYM